MANRVGDIAETATGIVLRVSGYSAAANDVSIAEWQESGLEATNLELLNEKEQAEKSRSQLIPRRGPPSSHPLIQQLERQDFFAQLFLTRALLRDFESQLRSNDQKSLCTNSFYYSDVSNDGQLESLQVALGLVEDTLRQIYATIQSLEKQQQLHSQKWFSSWRKLNVGNQLSHLVELGPQLKSRTEQLLQIKLFWMQALQVEKNKREE